ncbi:PilN domain-containing protein [Kosakonia sacchari]|uniref:Pilus assembly protein HofN n=1 Tax=Kosakonia sacchari TaxID=1158459 RepID=A0A1G4ZBV8_9ENTR|nr:PilN domain-containing protein [Kosakonia sacchari]AHJ76257.1 fimbrial assembly protein [Kosakonia sacchari SP1]SCX62718.1 pilus assembly protein HofN [Kosakonia sacchari]
MQPAVNFLPWRRQQRLRCIRLWGAVFIATALVIVLGGTLWRALAAVDLRQATLWQRSDAALLAGLNAAEQPLQLRRQRWQQEQAQLLRLQRTQAWRQTLLTLAENLPPNAWFTTLRWQQNQLEIAGLAGSFHALSELEQGLQKTTGFQLQPAGTVERDAQGRWQFHYQLNRERDDAQP